MFSDSDTIHPLPSPSAAPPIQPKIHSLVDDDLNPPSPFDLPDRRFTRSIASPDPRWADDVPGEGQGSPAHDPVTDGFEEASPDIAEPTIAVRAFSPPAWMSRGCRTVAPWVTSMAVHAALFVILSLVLIPLIKDDSVQIVMQIPPADDPTEVKVVDDMSIEAQPFAATAEPPVAARVVDLPPEKVDQMSANSSTVVLEHIDLPLPSLTPSVDDHDFQSKVPGGKSFKPKTKKRTKRKAKSKTEPLVAVPTTPQLRNAFSTDEAIDGIFAEIETQLADDDLLVVWLFDSSISLVNDRQRIADRMTTLFEKLKQNESLDEKRLKNVAVAFGNGVQEIVRPTDRTKKIIEAVRKVPIDQSGYEKVFGAIEWCVRRYQKKVQGRFMFVVWTDESGDDLTRLERTIQGCRNAGARVSFVGPSAVLSRKMGTHSWTERRTNKTYWLPVTKGPESAIPSRLKLPYWYESETPEWADEEDQDRDESNLPAWYGGPQLEGLSSGFGPYALTRLSAATGGSYTIFDRKADRGPFVLDDLQRYLPDYRSAVVIEKELRFQPLRLAVARAVEILREGKIDDRPPERMFFVRR